MFEIKIYAEHESELYNSFDREQKKLSDDLQNYISDCLAERSLGEKVRYVFESSDKIDEDHLKTAFAEYVLSAEKKLRKEKRYNTVQSIRLLIIGVIFVIIGIVLGTSVNVVIATIISTIGSFSIWEAANRWLIEIPQLKAKNRVLRFLDDYEIEVRTTR